MKTNYDYTIEKLELAVFHLTIGKGDVRSRLYEAYWSLRNLDSNDFPIELREEWGKIIEFFLKEKPYRANGTNIMIYDSAKMSLMKIKNKTGSTIAEGIWDLYHNMNSIRSIKNQ